VIHEAYESVLVELNEVIVTQEYDEWNEWDVDDGSGSCIISTGFFDPAEEEVPIIMNYPFEMIQGIVSYTWGEFQLNPRSPDDIFSANSNYVISIPELNIFGSEMFTIPVMITNFGDEIQAENYEFSLDFDPEVISFNGFSTENTISNNGGTTVELPVDGTLNIDFLGELVAYGTNPLINLNFTGISSGSTQMEFSEFFIDQMEAVYFSVGAITVQVESISIGDTLTVIQRPLLNIPQIALPGDVFEIECAADNATAGWFAQLQYNEVILPLSLEETVFNDDLGRWILTAAAPEPDLYELYDLIVGASNLETDTTANAVRLIPEYKEDYSFVHITDTHLPTHIFYPDPESMTDESELEDLREVITDINLINPEFVLITGDLVNEGEMEDFENRRVYTKAQKLLSELEVPFYLVAGNHDLGGWYDSPPSQGTARRDWWRFFGWKWLLDPPEVEPYRTQNYSFRYGSEHFIGMESYINYDDYLWEFYGDVSFTSNQLEWLETQLSGSGAENQILFYHMDFDEQINLNAMGIEMVLYGHIHSSSGDINNPPYNLSTEGTCDGERAYRVINVESGELLPQNTVSSGWNGNELNIEFFPANDGTADSISAIITNQHDLAFNDALVKFLIPSGEYEYFVENGELMQINDHSDPQTVYVSVDIPANNSLTVTLNAEPDNPASDDQLNLMDIQLHNYPNPFNPETVISFQVSGNGSKNVELTIYNMKGQKVKVFDTFPNGSLGTSRIIWNGTDQMGLPVSSGIYLYRLKMEERTWLKKMILLR